MERKTLLADVHSPGLPVCTAVALIAALEEDAQASGTWRIERSGVLLPAFPRVFVSLAHELTYLTWREISERRGEIQMRRRLLAAEHVASANKGELYRARTAKLIWGPLEIILGQCPGVDRKLMRTRGTEAVVEQQRAVWHRTRARVPVFASRNSKPGTWEH